MNKTICWKALLTILFIVLTNQAAVTVNKLDNISSQNLVYSGFLPISDTSSDQLFFTYYGKQNVQQQSDLKNYPLLIVVGSPGSSAQFINFAGMGPIKLKSDMTTVENNQSPSIFANVMFVDLLGNGFSFVADTSSFPTKSEDYGVQLTYAINAFAQQSALGKSNVVVILGEGTFVRSLTGLDDIDTLSGIIHISSWPELYAVSKYYGLAGVELKLFGSSQKIAIDSTLISCSNYVTNKKYTEAHNCYESILGFVQSKTKNANLFNVQLGSNLTDHMATIQYYLSQSSVLSSLKAPTNKMFDTQSNLVWGKTFVDLAINKTSTLSQFMKDYLTIKHWFIGGSNDFISYKQSIRLWLENELSFVESTAFRTAKLDDIMIEGSSVGYGKQVKQVKYTELFNAGHYIINDQTKVFAYLLNNWLSGLSGSQQKNLVEEQSQVFVAQE